MGEKSTRERIVDAADRLFYERGYEPTSFADIANAVEISRGNFYHHFKSKDDILHAVIELRLEKTRGMLEAWERQGARPEERIRSFIRILITNEALIRQYGCPVGTLCTELAKLGHASRAEASALFTLFRTWLRRQFELLGHEADADPLALHVLARSQGVAVLFNAFGDPCFVRQEVDQICTWLSSLAARPRRSRKSQERPSST